VKRKDEKVLSNLKRRNWVKRKKKEESFIIRRNVNLPSALKIMRRATVVCFGVGGRRKLILFFSFSSLVSKDVF